MSNGKKQESNATTVAIPKIAEEILNVEILIPAHIQNRMTDAEKDKIAGRAKPGNKTDFSKKSENWRETGHYDAKGHVGFPAEGFLRAMGSSVQSVTLSKHKLFKYAKNLYRALHVESDFLDQDGVGCVLLKSEHAPEMIEHWAVIRGQSPMPIYRTLVKDATAILRIPFNASLLTTEDVLLLVARAGLNGIGAFRPENRGPYGTFAITRAWIERREIAAKAAA